MDYEFLRGEGIRHLERLCQGIWTDFNAHDPGVTILEQVCYAITDLAYRIDFDIKDLLTFRGEDAYRSLHSPAEVLTIEPVTLADLRKLAIDVPGVKNAWFEGAEGTGPAMAYDPSEELIYLSNGSTEFAPSYRKTAVRDIYRVLLEIDGRKDRDAASVVSEVDALLRSRRSLCRDFFYPSILNPRGIVVDAAIEVGFVEDPEKLLAEIYRALTETVSPDIRFHTLAEMLARGKSVDEIMEGPVLRHGFIDDAELTGLERKAGIRSSDLMGAILRVEGATAVSSIRVSDGIRTEPWYLKLDDRSAPFLDIKKSLFAAQGPGVFLTRRGIRIEVDPGRVERILEGLAGSSDRRPLPPEERDIFLPAGRDRNIGRYRSIQGQFPAAYGIGPLGLPESADPRRKAQAKQLKAYLLFFDQVLANYFAQLGNARKLFSFYDPEPRSYFSQAVEDDGLGLREIIADDLETHAAEVARLTDLTAWEVTPVDGDDPAASGRKNRFMSHLLARFAEQFTDYSLFRYARINEQNLIEVKSAFLRNYHGIGSFRGCGFDYTLPSGGTGNALGLERRVRLKLGMSPRRRGKLADMEENADDSGFYVLEHILLRPGAADEMKNELRPSAFIKGPAGEDPYSRRISYVFPDWVRKYAESGYRSLIEGTLCEETPAHIHAHLRWLDCQRMADFESAYGTWIDGMIATRWWNPPEIKPEDETARLARLALRDARDRMIRLLGIGEPYPLRDLILDFPAIVPYSQSARILIKGGQVGALYRLCDEDGDPIVQDGNRFEVLVDPSMAAGGIFLATPAILRDITFTVLAILDDGAESLGLEAYLTSTVSVQVGIDTTLPISFVPRAESRQIGGGSRIAVNYGDAVSVRVSRTQEGVSYRLTAISGEAPEDVSSPQKGNQKDLVLVSGKGFDGDTRISVRAYRTASPKNFTFLDTELKVDVRPDPALSVELDPEIVDYGVRPVVRLPRTQSGVRYELYFKLLVPEDYLPDGTPEGILVPTDEGRQVSVRKPVGIDPGGKVPDGFTLSASAEGNGGAIVFDPPPLFEDGLFILRATKMGNGESIWLDRSVVILARPDTARKVGRREDRVSAGSPGTVTVEGTQKGVAYQLLLDGKAVNQPAYHLTDRGVERVRVAVDLVVEQELPSEEGPDFVALLPTGPISGTALFTVFAMKVLSGVGAVMAGSATISALPPGPGGEVDNG